MRCERLYFSQFYDLIIQDSDVVNKLGLLADSELCTQEVRENICCCLKERLQQICVRTLIMEMHDQKDRGHLKGNTPEDEYQYFCEQIAGKREYVSQIFSKYSVLRCCINEKISDTVNFYIEMLKQFKDEKKELEKLFQENGQLGRIVEIKGDFSDSHNGGKQVLELSFESGGKILYKPRAMENEKYYAFLLEWIAEKTGIRQLSYPILSYPDHSWCTVVPNRTCETKQQLQEYYRRIGSQLFLAYVLGTKDLHYENIIACGEYPVLVDLETLVNIQYNAERKTVDEEMRYQLSRSVLFTGLLPFYSWNHTGEGVDSSGIHGGEPYKCPFRIAAVADGGTSDMRIEYRHPWTHKARNRALLDGEYISPHIFADEVIDGFTKAYRAVLDNKKEFLKLTGTMRTSKSRYLVADTQRYSMMLSGSYHPGLLEDEENRNAFLKKLSDGRRISRHEIIEREIEALKRGDIPYFFYELGDTGLQDKDGFRIEGFFLEAPFDLILEKIEQLGKKDLSMQRRFIEMALRLVPENEENFKNKIYHIQEINQNDVRQWENESGIEELRQRLYDSAVWNKERTEVSWPVLDFASGRGYAWEIRPMNYYLYNGLAGMLLLFYELQLRELSLEDKEIYDALQSMLFGYTDRGVKDPNNLYSTNTGVFDGESSIVFVYLLLHKRSGQMQYLHYAERHAGIVGRLIRNDRKYDLLSGNAGAAKVMILLYEITGKSKYLEMAENAVNVLEDNKIITGKGCGWSIGPDIAPMGGMAHGNSGILMAVIDVWIAAGNEKYGRLAEEIWDFEDSLYSEEQNNWMDTRAKIEEDETGPVAWCHGAGGILLSRLSCYAKVTDEKWKQRMLDDIQKAYAKLESFWIRDSISLCHGSAGNGLILEYARKMMSDENDSKNGKVMVAGKGRVCEQADPGMMNGYGGLLYCMVCGEDMAIDLLKVGISSK